MAALTYEEALKIAADSYRKIFTVSLPITLSDLERRWLSNLAWRAAYVSDQIKYFSFSWTLLYLFKDGIKWQVRVEGPLVRKAGVMVLKNEEHEIPDLDSLNTALSSPESFGLWWERWSPHIYCAIFRGDQAMANILPLLWPPKYIRLPDGWFDALQLWIEIAESTGAPGPKPRELVEKCKKIIMAFPAKTKYPEGEIDLTFLAAKIIVRRIKT